MVRYRLLIALVYIFIFLPLSVVQGQNNGLTIWAASDGVKVDKFNINHPFKSGNYTWNKDTVRLFGALNEVIAFQVIIETSTLPITIDNAGLEKLTHEKFQEYEITYIPPDIDPTIYTGRPIQVFNLHYMEVVETTNASWIHLPSLPSAIEDPQGWKPVQLVPENALNGRGGFPIQVDALQNQAIWFDIYIEKDLLSGFYIGNILIETSENSYNIPVKLEVLDFKLPDENSLNAMFYFGNSNAAYYMGNSFEHNPCFHRFAHRHRVEFVHAYDIESIKDDIDRFNGWDFIPENGYEGPGENIGNKIVPRTFYWTPEEWLDQATARTLSDEWMEFINENIPNAITFLYMPDEPGPAEFPFIRSVADNIHSNPGPGKDLDIFVSHGYTDDLDGYIDIWAAVPRLIRKEWLENEHAKGNQMWFYNGGRPHVGAIINDASATDSRMIAWAAYKERINSYFYWHVNHWYHNHQFGPGPDSPLRAQNIWQNSITFERRPQYNDWANGDGVLIYPGRELVHPEEDRGIDGPVSSVRMANFRRGMQDHLYLTMARKRGLYDLINNALEITVTKVFAEVDYDDMIHYEQNPDIYDSLIYKLGKAISENDEITGWTNDLNTLPSLKIYPNPLSGNAIKFHLRSDHFCKIQVDIFNVQGQFLSNILKTQSYNLEIEKILYLNNMNTGLKPGIYIIRTKIQYSNSANDVKMLKLVKF